MNMESIEYRAYEKVDAEFKSTDINDMLEQMIEDGELCAKTAKAPSVELLNRILDRDENYMEAYWNAIRYAINVANEKEEL